ncbi:hypothetical protein SDC9_206538 [bioreactor metagenome]|uniref:Uncharacterized protein n=1 Tax=bioreactor metagenome TaxID=1076179 RepID=A0A645JGW3_9ZZZZ
MRVEEAGGGHHRFQVAVEAFDLVVRCRRRCERRRPVAGQRRGAGEGGHAAFVAEQLDGGAEVE